MVKAMPTDKDIQFVQFLLDSTRSGKIQWQPSAEQDQFTTTLKQKYTAYVTKRGIAVTLLLTDSAGQELVAVDSLTYPPVEGLFEFVRREALDVDSVLDQIMQGGLVITSAKYGCGDHRLDVSRELNDAIKNDKLHVVVGNQLAGDPCPNVAKDLLLGYKFGDKTFQRTAREGETLDLP